MAQAAPTPLIATAPLQGTVVSVPVAVGDVIAAGTTLAVLESMKMEHVVVAEAGGTVREVTSSTGDTVEKGDRLVVIEPGEVAGSTVPTEVAAAVGIRPELAEVFTRREVLRDESRPEAMARRHGTGHRSARENLADLCDPGSFVEYGGLVVAAQRRRRSLDELIERTPADGLVGGIARVNGDRLGPDRARCAVLSYDYTVLAGTQGHMNHRKKDRLFDVIERLRLPVVLFAEGGGGRPGDTDGATVSGLETQAFALFARLSGLVPIVGVVGGRCFAGNAALLGCCDVIIATADTTVGMGGPAMIEGGGLGVFPPEAVGPMSVQVENGVVDVAVDDDVAAVAAAKQYLSYFQGPLADWGCADQVALRGCVPEDRRRVYDVHSVIELLADTGSALELRAGFAPAMVTALARLEGRPVGIVANNPMHLAGAIDAVAADKAARFLQLCDAYDLPVVFLCDTPGFMVGPDAERAALVRHAGRLFVTGASLTVPFCTVILRKAYGLGAQAMAGGSFREPLWIGAWPTGELGPMGLEGAVRLGFRRELDAVEDPAERQALFETMVQRSYANGKAINVASYFEIDDVIDPTETRQRLASVFGAAPPPPPRTGKKRPFVDPW
ncbi:MAG TPA: carboxyl transferase domain-containing protein [Acidimicrobiales bacterium]|nr:carboxyl transferase domain-containing protein [Acidimicrobiales bacterium]